MSNEDQYDLLDIVKACHNDEFWVTVHEPDAILGSIGLLTYGRTGVLKKFILAMPYRGNDVPAIATRSRACYERNGLQRAAPGDLPACYRYPERDSFLYRLRLVLPS